MIRSPKEIVTLEYGKFRSEHPSWSFIRWLQCYDDMRLRLIYDLRCADDHVSDGDENHNHGFIRPDEFRRQYQVDSYRHISHLRPFSSLRFFDGTFAQAGILPHFHLVFSFSSVEHSGLGRHSIAKVKHKYS